MSVTLSNGASVVAFIGLSINTLRGLHYLYDVVRSVKDAPQDLQSIYFQLRFFQLSFSTFQHSLEEAVNLGIATPLDAQTRLVIDDVQNTIVLFQDILCQHGEGRATTFSTRLRIAMKKTRFDSLSRRLEKISEQIHATHCGITMLAQNHHHQLCAANSSNLDKKLLMLQDTAANHTPQAALERLEAINQAVTESAKSIINLIGDMSQMNRRQLNATRSSPKFQRTPSIPFDMASNVKSSGQQSLGDDLVAQLSAHFSLVIRDEVREILLHSPFLAGKDLSSSELDDILRQIFDKHGQKFASDAPSQTLSWRKLFRVVELASVFSTRAKELRTATMFQAEISQCGQLLLELLEHPDLFQLRSHLITAMKFICFLEPVIHTLKQPSTAKLLSFILPGYDRFSYFFSAPLEQPPWSQGVPYLLQSHWIAKNVIDVQNQYDEPKTDLIDPELDLFSLIDGTDSCTNVTGMSFYRYQITSAHLLIEPLPEGDCIIIPKPTFSEVSGAKKIKKIQLGYVDSDNTIKYIDDWSAGSRDWGSLLLPTLSLLTIAVSWVSRYHVQKFLMPLGNFLATANFVRIVTDFGNPELTMWCLRHASLWLTWNPMTQLREQTLLESFLSLTSGDLVRSASDYYYVYRACYKVDD
ncbi:hypothetical protein BKA64DRAFT_53411 [Cadophora sp. MPI-SDFR-AT-0126]|nr:hypothetical protein BKA64DRAFT_53411 [Leotiomycetes sp. MPI-SDFR-AT-0126]